MRALSPLNYIAPYFHTWIYRVPVHAYTYECAPAYTRFIRGKESQPMTYSLDRFLSQNDHIDCERPPAAFGQVRDQAMAEAEETTAMCARLDVFDQKFRSGANQSIVESPAKVN